MCDPNTQNIFFISSNVFDHLRELWGYICTIHNLFPMYSFLISKKGKKEYIGNGLCILCNLILNNKTAVTYQRTSLPVI